MRNVLLQSEKFALVAVVLFLGLNALMLNSLTAVLGIDADYSAGERVALQNSALGAIFQEVRLGLGDILWLKTDEYIHSGVMYRSMKPEEILRRDALANKQQELVHEHDDHSTSDPEHAELDRVMGYDESHERSLVSLIPHKPYDFRGFIGDIERAVKPYATQHIPHKDLVELIPWYRLITFSNPHHARAYLVGSFFIYTYGKCPQEALEFLKEGERHNPKSPDIQEALGRMYLYKLNQPEKAIPYYHKAIKFFNERINEVPLTIEEEEIHRNAYISLVLAYIQLEDLLNAEIHYEEVKKLYPEDRPVRDLRYAINRLRKTLSNSP